MHKRFLLTVIALLMAATFVIAPFGAGAVSVDEMSATQQQPVMTIAGFNNTDDGTQISWAAYDGAARYQIYLHDGIDWTELTQTDQLKCVHPALEDGAVYRYNIRALDAEGNYLTAFDADGFENRFFAPPVITSIAYNADGVSMQWSANENAARFRVYRKTAGQDWTAVGESDTPAYLDATAVEGTTYSYTVQCLDAEGGEVSAYNDGKSVICGIVPEITKFENLIAGTKITFTKPAGAEKIRVYVKDNNSWTRLTETSGTTFNHNQLAAGKTYTYTVRSVKNGKFTSEYNRDGWDNTFIESPEITSLTASDDGVTVKWRRPAGSVRFRVYTKETNGWKRIGETDEDTFLATGLTSGRSYTFTVRCVSADGKTFTSAYNNGKSIRYFGIPKITGFSNTATGTKISFAKPVSGVRTRVYFKNGSGWTRIGETDGSSVVHDKLKAGQTYTYTVRLVDTKGKFLSEFNREGWQNTFIEPPVITELVGTDNGVNVKWKKPAGSVKFRLYTKEAGSWKRLVDTADNSYLVTNLKSGNTYTFTVRCISEDGAFTSFHNSGKSIKYVVPPVITGFENTATGTRATWTGVTGAAKYRLYAKQEGQSWTKVAETSAANAVYDNLANGSSYIYTVRALDSKNQFITDYNRTGWSYTFIAPPAISSVTASNRGVEVAWNDIDGDYGFRLYRKPFAGSWGKLVDTTATAYTDTTAEADQLYAYTLRALDESGKTVSGYIDNKRYYVNGAPANGTFTVNGKDYYFKDGSLRSGFTTIDGKKYYYNSAGTIVKNAVVGSASEGYYYAGKDGVIDPGYCNGVTYNGADWNVINGKATKVSGNQAKTLHKALKVIAKVTNSSMTKEQKLRACFNHLTSSYGERNPRIPHSHDSGWEVLYANDIFDKGYGNCFSYGAAFAFLARGIGYTDVYACSSGGHGWAEVNGKVYDPEWRMHHSEYSYFGMSYTEPCDVNYRAGIAPGYSWMHVKIK